MRNYFEETLYCQERAMKKARRNRLQLIDENFFDLILPSNYEGVLNKIRKEDQKKFADFLRRLNGYRKERLYRELSYLMIGECLMANLDEISKTISEVLPVDLKRFFNNKKVATHLVFSIFCKCDVKRKIYLIREIFSQETIVAIVCYGVENEKDQSVMLLKLLQKIWKEYRNTELKETVFKKMAQLPPKKIAELVQEDIDSEVIQQIFQYMENFISWNLDEAGWKRLYKCLPKQKIEMRKRMSIEAIYCMYHYLEKEEKKDILFGILENNEINELYGRHLSQVEQIEMMDLMIESGKIKVLKSVIDMLSSKKQLTYIEGLCLADLKNKIS